MSNAPQATETQSAPATEQTTNTEVENPQVEAKQDQPVESAPVPTKAPLETTVTLSDNSTIVIKKLKAGPYYKAQKFYAEWLSSLSDLISGYSKTMKFTDEEIKQFQNEDGTPNQEKIAEISKKAAARNSSVDTTKLLEGINKPMEIRKKFIAEALSISEEELDNKYYPEDLDSLFEGILKVNNFMDSLKKSVSLMGEAMKTI